jgi:hypothetical protein
VNDAGSDYSRDGPERKGGPGFKTETLVIDEIEPSVTIESLARPDFPEFQLFERSRVAVTTYLDGDEIFIAQVIDINNDGGDGSHVRHFFAQIV